MHGLNARNVNNAVCQVVVKCGSLTVTGHFTHCHILAGRVLTHLTKDKLLVKTQMPVEAKSSFCH